MENDEKQLFYIRYLLSKALEGTAGPEDMQQLDQCLRDSAQARRYYVELLQIHVTLRKLLEKNPVTETAPQEDVLDGQLWAELARHEQAAESIIVESCAAETACESDSAIELSPPQKAPKLSRLSRVGVITSIAAALLVVFYLHVVPVPSPIVATLSDAIDARWDSADQALVIGEDVRAERQHLLSGLLSMTFESGVEVVIEGPAEYQPLSANKMMLWSGKAFAHVSKTAIGFTIDTPQSSVVDLGTEFGVAVAPNGTSEVYVYDGKVNLIAGLASQPKQSEILLESQARHVDASEGTIRQAAFKEYLFVQKISSKDNRIWHGPPVRLASLVAGGDGLTPGDQPSGINPATGRVNSMVVQDFNRVGAGGYSPVAARPFVDGVFVPNGPSVISSEGHRFDGFPETSNSFWSDITTSPVLNHIALNDAGQVLYHQQLVAVLATPQEVQDDEGISPILMHANSAITFDLRKIREMEVFQGAAISRFRAVCGVSKNVMARMNQEFWVLLDGQLVYHTRRVGEDLTAQSIDIPIRPDQSFLTLATTDGGDSSSFDWCVFEDAVLELVPEGSQRR